MGFFCSKEVSNVVNGNSKDSRNDDLVEAEHDEEQYLGMIRQIMKKGN